MIKLGYVALGHDLTAKKSRWWRQLWCCGLDARSRQTARQRAVRPVNLPDSDAPLAKRQLSLLLAAPS